MNISSIKETIRNYVKSERPYELVNVLDEYIKAEIELFDISKIDISFVYMVFGTYRKKYFIQIYYYMGGYKQMYRQQIGKKTTIHKLELPDHVIDGITYSMLNTFLIRCKEIINQRKLS